MQAMPDKSKSQTDRYATPPPYEQDNPAAHVNEDADALLSYFNAPLPDRAALQPLRMPLCLPQAAAGPTALFSRAYSPELIYSGITMEEWMHFVDALNLAMAASPPLRVLDAAGMIIGFVPHWWFTVAAAAMQTSARVGMVVVAKTLSDRLLQRANAEFFAPRGLRVRICRTAAMRQIVGLSAAKDKKSAGERLVIAGRVAENVALHLPVIRKLYNRVAPSVPRIDSSSSGSDANVGSMAQRRLGSVVDHALPLDFNVPPPAPPETIMQKASGMSMRLEKWKENGAEASANQNRQLLAIAEGRAPSLPPRAPSGSSSNWAKQAWDFRQQHKLAKKEQRAQRKMMSGRQSRSLQSKVEIADRKEYNATDRLLWLVLLNAEQDEAIQGKELADDPSATEQIPEAEWQEELEEEAEEAEDAKGYN